MVTQKNEEKNIVLELKRQLGRMMVQVDYMYRNDREMSRLDLDILMEHTRDLYELLCDYQVADVAVEAEMPETREEPDMNGENGDADTVPVLEEPEEPEEPEIPAEKVTKHVLEVDENDLDEEDWEDEDDEMFRIEPESMEPEDNSLAARLQRSHVSDIRMAIGINDKVMIVNDLFGGSVERYNKSIDALNDFPTLSGARVYMSELQIELQWDTELEAYKLLNDLVERRFI